MIAPKLPRYLFGLLAPCLLGLVVAAGCPFGTEAPSRPTTSSSAPAASLSPPPIADDDRPQSGPPTIVEPSNPAEPANVAQSAKVAEPANVVAQSANASGAANASEPAIVLAAADEPKQAGGESGGAPRTADHTSAVKFDPVLVNGTFFEGWPKPKLALVISGRQDGYLEPCGCAGLENQKGGLSRRHSLIKQLAGEGWPLAAVDVGSLVRRFGKQAELQFGISAEALGAMHYVAAGFGAGDLRLSAGEVAAAVTGADPIIFVSANVDLFGLTPRFRIVEAGGMKLGITSVLGDEFRQQVNNTELQVKPAEAALAEVAPQLKGCDLQILLANATLEESQALGRKFPQFNVVVTGGGPDEPKPEVMHVEGGKALLIEVGHKGMYAVVLGFYDDPQQPPVRYQRVALDSRFPASAEMKSLMTTYQSQLQSLGWSGLGLRPAAHPRSKVGSELAGQFVGAASCRECHQQAWDVWSKSKHAHATETLAKLRPARQFDPECVSCHVTGWNPQEFFPYKSGFESQEKTPQLVGNSCENCHGPGAAHIAAERAGNPARRAEWRALMHQDKESADEHSCRKCHDLDNSLNFNFEKYWADIAH